jgi:hypothetical protein
MWGKVGHMQIRLNEGTTQTLKILQASHRRKTGEKLSVKSIANQVLVHGIKPWCDIFKLPSPIKPSTK